MSAPVARPFVAPACAYCAGQRGVEYDVAPGTAVRAGRAGVVTFSGVVAGVRYVVVRDDDGISATYGKVQSSRLRSGDSVNPGALVAASGAQLYFGLRAADGTAIDPAGLLASASRRARLVPGDGSPGRPATVRAARCAPAGATAWMPR